MKAEDGWRCEGDLGENWLGHPDMINAQQRQRAGKVRVNDLNLGASQFLRNVRFGSIADMGERIRECLLCPRKPTFCSAVKASTLHSMRNRDNRLILQWRAPRPRSSKCPLRDVAIDQIFTL
jgi:hypothetical protein